MERFLTVTAAVLCLVVGVGSWILKSYTDNGIAWIGVGAAVAMFLLGSRLLANRTQAGVEAAARAAGLKKFLKDFSVQRFLSFAAWLPAS